MIPLGLLVAPANAFRTFWLGIYAQASWCSRSVNDGDGAVNWLGRKSAHGRPLSRRNRLMLPILEALRSDDDLERLLTDMLDRGCKPEWVLSSRPGFARLPDMLEALRSY
jgi:hypothetical protein